MQRIKRNFNLRNIFFLSVIVFSFLIMKGITGSSLSLEYNNSLFEFSKVKHIEGHARPIRSDEWAVFTPKAIGQYNHHPAFPIINENVGSEGENMLIFSMVGMPVKHISLLGKPATWGFFLFDLNKALAWYWWFPLFGCFLALCWMFSLLFPNNFFLSFCLSLTFCMSSYMVAWSFWPSYLVFFPSLAFCSLISLLKTHNKLLACFFSLLLGLSATGFLLTLYPPWQISLAFLFLMLTIGYFSMQKRNLTFNYYKLFCLGLGLLLTTYVIMMWWHDAKFAIETLSNTIYPGKRSLLTGGDKTLHSLLRGYVNIATLYLTKNAGTNASEMASFYFLYIPLLFALFFKIKKSPQSIKIIIPIFLYVVFCFIYMFYGISLDLSRWTLWGHVPTQRLDLALGLAIFLLYGMVLYHQKNEISKTQKNIAHFVALAWAIFISQFMLTFPYDVLVKLSEIKYLFIVISTYLASYFLIVGYRKSFLLTSLVMCLVTTIHFNPFYYAPKNIRLSHTIDTLLHANKKVLILGGDWTKGNALVSAGIPTLNPTMYYPQKKFWDKLGIDIQSNNTVNRYQHLVFTLDKSTTSSNYFSVTLPIPDSIEVKINPTYFNFNSLGSLLIMTPTSFKSALMQNPSLHFLRTIDEWSWFVTYIE